MMLVNYKILLLLAFSSSISRSEKWSPHSIRYSEEDLTAQESRYKVVAKPVPYKPLKPAPPLDDFQPVLSTTTEKSLKFESFKPKKYDNADIIYPTTTYRPQKFQLSELLAHHNSPGPSVDKYLPTAATTTSKPPTTTESHRRKPRKNEFINEIPFGTRKRKVNKNRKRKVVKRVKKKNSKRWRQNHRKTTTVTTTTTTTTTTTKKPFLLDLYDETQDTGIYPFTPLPPLRPRPNLFQHAGDDIIESVKTPRKARPQLFTPAPAAPTPTRFSPPVPTRLPAVRPTPPRRLTTTLAPVTPSLLPVTPAVPSLPFTPVTPVPSSRQPAPTQIPPILHSRPTPPPPVPSRQPAFPPIVTASTPLPPVAPPRPRRPKFNLPPPPQPRVPVHLPPPPKPKLPPPPVAFDYIDDNEIAYYDEQPKPYSFTYGVKDEYSGTDFSRAEERRGEAIEGSYKVALPDGRVQIVSYVADDDGYRATVSYEGEPEYPPPGPAGPNLPAADVFHALPPVKVDKNHASFVVNPAGEPLPLFEDYDYYDDGPALVTPLPPKPSPYSPSPTYASPTPKPSYAPPTPHSYSPKPAYAPPYSPTPEPAYVSPTPKPSYGPPEPAYASPTPKPSYAPPTPHPYSPKPSYGPPEPSYGPPPELFSPYTPSPPPAYVSPAYASPTPAPDYNPSPTTVKSLRPKKYGLKIPNYSTLAPTYQFYAPTTYAPPPQAYTPFNEVFKRKVDNNPNDDYDYEYYETDDSNDYVYSQNRRSSDRSRHHQVQLVIAEHLHQK